MTAFAALLRGINVGGHNKVPMPKLRSIIGAIGLEDAETHIQSGNVVFNSVLTDTARLAQMIEVALGEELGFAVPVVVRSTRELAAITDRNPFVQRGADAAVLSVGFLARIPEQARLEMLAADRLADPVTTGGDEFSVAGQEVFLYHPAGYGKSKLTNAFFDRRLGTMMTVRNWRTFLTLVEMTGRLDPS